MNAATMPPPMKYSTEKAKQAGQGQRIEDTGAYVGVLTKVKWITSAKGAQGYELDFKSESGQVAERLGIYTIGKNGQALTIGEANIAALLCCLSVGEANAVAGTVEEYDFDSQMKVMNNVYLFPDAMNKPIGLFLQKDVYTKSNGDDGIRMQLECSFRAVDRMIAKEIIEKQPATHIDKLTEWMGDKDSRTNKTAAAPQYDQQQASAVATDFDDDVPW